MTEVTYVAILKVRNYLRLRSSLSVDVTMNTD